MPFRRTPIPIERRPRRGLLTPRVESADQLLNTQNLFSSLVLGPGVMAAISLAAALQHGFPWARFEGFPLAGLVGLLLGWVLAVPGARQIARRVDPQRPAHVLMAAVLMGFLLTTPAAFFAPAIGWLGGAVRLYIVAGVLSASGLVWGGYFNGDALLRE